MIESCLVFVTVAGPRLWNALPISLRQPHLSLGQFRQALKRIYLTVSVGPSDFLFLGADYTYLLTYKGGRMQAASIFSQGIISP